MFLFESLPLCPAELESHFYLYFLNYGISLHFLTVNLFERVATVTPGSFSYASFHALFDQTSFPHISPIALGGGAPCEV